MLPRPAARALTLPSSSASGYGRALTYADPPTLARWTGSARLAAVALFRWYLRIFGYPELAAHRRFMPVQQALQRSGDTVLDVGAGSGLYSLADATTRPAGRHLVVDLSRRHMQRAQATARALGIPLEAVVCDAAALPFPDEALAAVLMIEVLQFTDDDTRVIAELARVLRPDGRWVCEQEIAEDKAGVVPATSARPESRLMKRRAGYSELRLRSVAGAHGLILERTQVVAGRCSRWCERLESKILARSRALHLTLFPFLRVLAAMARRLPGEAAPGTVLFEFRKRGSDTRSPAPASELGKPLEGLMPW